MLQTARVYDIAANTLQGTFAAGAPVLDALFENPGVVYTAGLDGAVKRWVVRRRCCHASCQDPPTMLLCLRLDISAAVLLPVMLQPLLLNPLLLNRFPCVAATTSSKARSLCWAATRRQSGACSGCLPKACLSAAAGTGTVHAGSILTLCARVCSCWQHATTVPPCTDASAPHCHAMSQPYRLSHIPAGVYPCPLNHTAATQPRSAAPSPCSSLRLWDPRLGPGAAPVAQVALPGKVYSMSGCGTRLVVATSGRHVDIFDLRT
jgi:hypothetical protein